MRISPRRSLHLAGVIATSAAVTIGVLAGTANASPKTTGQATHEYCAVVLAKLKPGQTTSPVISKTCSTQHAKASSAPLGFSANDYVPLITFYQYTNYQGDSYTFYGGYGQCDAAGYGFQDGRVSDYGKGWGASSWQAHSNCWHTKLCYGYSYGGPCYTYPVGVWEAGQIGSPWGNHVWSFWVGSQ